MSTFVALTFSGIAYGAVLAVVAIGFIVLYKATGVINFAHGDLVTLGAYLAVWAITDIGMPILVGYMAALAIMASIGVVMDRVAYAPLRSRPPLTAVVATLAAAIVIRGAIAVWQGSTPKVLPSPVGDGVVNVAGAAISQQRLLVIGVGAAVIVGLLLLFSRSGFGRRLRAIATDPEMASLTGVNLGVTTLITFALSAALAGLAGILVAPLSTVDLNFGFMLMVAAFAAAVLGGFGSIGGAVIGALVIGLVQQLVGGYWLPDYATTLPFVVLLVAIVVRPSGIVSLQRSRL